MGGGKGKAPKPPDMTELANASIESARMWEAVSREQLEWAREQDSMNRELLNDVLQVQLPMLEEQHRTSMADRKRYEELFQPLEENLIREFEQYDSPERREQKAAERMADVRASFEAQRANAEQQLQGYGIDPGQLRTNALDRGIRAQEAAASAMAANQGRETVENTGRALRAEGINIGRGYPGQVAQTQALANQTGGGAINSATGVTGSSVGAMQGAFQAGSMGQQGLQQGANIQNMGYQNQLSQWQANTQASQAMWDTIGSVAGAGMMAFSDPALKENRRAIPAGSALDAVANSPAEQWEYRGDSGLDDGQQHVGPMADDMQREAGIGNGSAMPMQDVLGLHHAALGEISQALREGGRVGNAYVVPEEVLSKKGTEFFERMIAKYRSGGEQGGARRAVEA